MAKEKCPLFVRRRRGPIAVVCRRSAPIRAQAHNQSRVCVETLASNAVAAPRGCAA